MNLCLTWGAFQEGCEEKQIIDWCLLCAIDILEHKEESALQYTRKVYLQVRISESLNASWEQ